MWGTKLPKKAGGSYLVTYQGVVRQARLVETWPKGKFGWCILPNCGTCLDCDVTAWQKQPEPYKAK